MDIEIFEDNGRVYVDAYINDKLSGINKVTNSSYTTKTINSIYNYNIYVMTYQNAGSRLQTDTRDYKGMLSKYPNVTIGYTLPTNVNDYELSNGIVEGINNLIKQIKRNACGYRKFKHLKFRVMLIKGLYNPIQA